MVVSIKISILVLEEIEGTEGGGTKREAGGTGRGRERGRGISQKNDLFKKSTFKTQIICCHCFTNYNAKKQVIFV